MDFTAVFAWMPTIIKLIGLAPKIQEAIRTGANVDQIISAVLPDIQPFLQWFGANFFPNVNQQLSGSAAIDVIFDSDGTKWVQNSLNSLGEKLTVDGAYGNLTKAAVSKFQTTHGLKVDGWAGPKTSGALAVEVAKRAV